MDCGHRNQYIARRRHYASIAKQREYLRKSMKDNAFHKVMATRWDPAQNCSEAEIDVNMTS